jgi:hypothetical protein
MAIQRVSTAAKRKHIGGYRHRTERAIQAQFFSGLHS